MDDEQLDMRISLVEARLNDIQFSTAEAGAVGDAPVAAPIITGDPCCTPYTVRWADDLEQWIIWIPENCLYVNGVEMYPESQLVPAGGSHPAGWYALSCVDELSPTLYLNVMVPSDEGDESSSDSDEDPVVTAVFTETPEEPGEDETVWPILICTLSGKESVQLVSSVITIGGGGRCQAAADIGCYSLVYDEHGSVSGFKNCYFMVGGLLYGGPNSTPGSGINALKIPCSGYDAASNATMEAYSSLEALQAAQSDYSYYIIPLWNLVQSGSRLVAVADFRSCPSASMGESGL